MRDSKLNYFTERRYCQELSGDPPQEMGLSRNLKRSRLAFYSRFANFAFPARGENAIIVTS